MKSLLLLMALTMVVLMPVSASAENENSKTGAEVQNRLPFHYDTEYSGTMMNWQESVTGKQLYMLKAAQKGLIGSPDFLFSGALTFSSMHEESNRAGKFPILSRLPGQHGKSGFSGSVAVVNNAAFAMTARFADWVTFYAQPEFTEVMFPGQESWQMRKIFAIVGNLDKSPLYGYFGRNTVDFGWMDAYNPFTHSVNNHFFRIDSDKPVLGLGYYQNGLHITGTLIPSGRHLRVADTEDDTGWKNGAISLSYDLEIGERTSLKVGAGYLHSTIYNRDIAHHPGAGFPGAVAASTVSERNPAYNFFTELCFDAFRVGFEYTTTEKDWPTTKKPVSAITAMAAYDISLYNVPLTFSAVYGLGRQGPDGEEYEKLSQFALGLEAKILTTLSLGFEYVRNDNFVPLINITTVSDKEVKTDTLIFGLKLRF